MRKNEETPVRDNIKNIALDYDQGKPVVVAIATAAIRYKLTSEEKRILAGITALITTDAN